MDDDMPLHDWSEPPPQKTSCGLLVPNIFFPLTNPSFGNSLVYVEIYISTCYFYIYCPQFKYFTYANYQMCSFLHALH